MATVGDSAYHAGMPEGRLSARQLLVLLLHARGYSHRQIAELLDTRPEHVDEIASSAARLLSTGGVSQAVAEAQRRNLI
jgi:DNA-binding NarL/FixJ family response regulator